MIRVTVVTQTSDVAPGPVVQIMIPGVRVGPQLESNEYEGIYRETSYNKANLCESNPR